MLKSSASGTVNYVYDGANVLEEVDGSGNVVARYTQGTGIDEPLAMLRSSTTSYYDVDGLGTVTSLSNSSGALASTYTYDSFGKLTGSTGTISNPYRYTARESDAETGLYYYRARYYDPNTGRFLSEDPIKDSAAGSLYAYVENSPVLWTDRFGTEQSVQNPSATIVGPATPQQASQINAGFAEALNRLSNPQCRNLFCQKNKNIDPAKTLTATQYEVSANLRSSSGGVDTGI